ncbi:hypothetical protein Ahy_A03g014514 isoform C [Arachis hypogaea]|uniref:Uncharacterized protein n=1 Tax=Arachis hypogaea TaxID=3818 RepID=A0A445DXY4_ARAHY|nr:hypothetical protein Ahy_A03g014514 isoform C [Arachis hypogaea]
MFKLFMLTVIDSEQASYEQVLVFNSAGYDNCIYMRAGGNNKTVTGNTTAMSSTSSTAHKGSSSLIYGFVLVTSLSILLNIQRY